VCVVSFRAERPPEGRPLAVHEQGVSALHELAQELPEAEAVDRPQLRTSDSTTELGEPPM